MQAMGPAVESSGGSAANTIVGVASFGGRAAFIGKVKDDELGRAFAHDIRAARVAFDVKPASDGPSTARCYIMVTPDGERTMNTFLGAAQDLTPADIDEANGRQRRASSISKAICGTRRRPRKPSSRRRRSRTRPAGAWRSRCRIRSASTATAREFLDLIRKGTVDIVFANEHELHSLYETADFDTAVKALRSDAKLAVVTRSEKGCVVVTRKAVEAVQAMPIEQVVDVTGAGDLFAAGFLVGLARGKDHRTAARLGALGGGRSDPAYRRAAGGLAQGAGGRERPAGLSFEIGRLAVAAPAPVTNW